MQLLGISKHTANMAFYQYRKMLERLFRSDREDEG